MPVICLQKRMSNGLKAETCVRKRNWTL